MPYPQPFRKVSLIEHTFLFVVSLIQLQTAIMDMRSLQKNFNKYTKGSPGPGLGRVIAAGGALFGAVVLAYNSVFNGIFAQLQI